jgi:hypothetical protein
MRGQETAHMLPGPDKIVACPLCQGLAKYATLRTGNTIGARVWTDGKEIAPMLPMPPTVVRCRHCAGCHWLADAKEVGEMEPFHRMRHPDDPAWEGVEYVEEPAEAEYYSAIEGGLARDREQERCLRTLAWWHRNDAFRDGSGTDAGPVAALSEEGRRNLVALAGLLDPEAENDLIMKAEVWRELGEFEAAALALSQVNTEKYRDVVAQLRALCESKDTGVRELRFDDGFGERHPVLRIIGVIFLIASLPFRLCLFLVANFLRDILEMFHLRSADRSPNETERRAGPDGDARKPPGD